MNIIHRVQDIIIKPRETWQVIKEEKIEPKQLMINYAAPLALIPTVCRFVGLTLFGVRMPAGSIFRAPFITSLIGSILGYAFALISLLVVAWLIKLLAPYFNSKQDFASGLKLIVYAMTPAWLAGIFSLIPGLAILSILGLYAIYLLAIGLPEILETPANKTVWFILAILVSAMVVSFIFQSVLVSTIYGPMYMKMMSL